jgi:hypothetical protein
MNCLKLPSFNFEPPAPILLCALECCVQLQVRGAGHSSDWPNAVSCNSPHLLANATSRRALHCCGLRAAGPLGSMNVVPTNPGVDASRSRAEAAAASWWRRQPRVDYTPFNEQQALELADLRARKAFAMKAKALQA